MIAKNEDLHGSVPDTSPVGLIIVDMINDLEFPEGPDFFEPALAAARCITILKKRARELNIPVIYVNDNFGRWRSSSDELVEYCLQNDVRGKPLVELLRPDPNDYVVLKPKHSIFYATTLDVLLTYLKTQQLIVTGISADVCILFSAIDAYMRDFRLFVPPDCIAAGSADNTKTAVDYMKRVLNAETSPSTDLNLQTLVQHPVTP